MKATCRSIQIRACVCGVQKRHGRWLVASAVGLSKDDAYVEREESEFEKRFALIFP